MSSKKGGIGSRIQNSLAMSSKRHRNQNRRHFLKSTGAMLGAGMLVRPSIAEGVPPSERIVSAHIGVGGMGNGHVQGFASQKDVDIAALCDVDESRRTATLANLQKSRPDTRTELYDDFRRVLERDDIDVISCATPDHWHALVTLLAFQSGKDVYSEKPLCHNVAEGRAMVDAGKRHERVFQLGTQIHAGDNYHRVVELVRSGALGKIHTVRLWMNGGAPNLKPTPDQTPPPSLDWNMWLGPAPWHAYNPARCPFNFRYFWDYSGGVFADFWCHIADIAFWSLDPGAPTTVVARGEDSRAGMATTHNWIDADFDFPDRKIYWTTQTPDVPGAQGKGIGCQFVGTDGTLVADYGSRALFLGDAKEPVTDLPEVPQTVPRSPGHHRDFLDCVKTRALTESNLPYAHNMTTPMHLANLSYRLGRKLTWNAQAEQFVGDEAANRLLFRPYRDPWWLPT